MSAISLKSITGITSITTPAGVDNQLTLHNNNTSEAVKLDIAGNVHINNQLAVTGVTTFLGDILFQCNSGNIFFDKSDNAFEFSDNVKAKFGGSADLEIYHSGSHSIIHDTGTGNLSIQSNAGEIQLSRGGSFEHMVRCIVNGAVELYHDGTKKFETMSYGAKWTGILLGADNQKLELGSSGDLSLYHDGTNSYIDNVNTGILRIRGGAGGSGQDIQIQAKNGEYSINAIPNGAVELYHDNVKKFETTSAAANFTVASNGQVNLFGLGGTNGLRISGPQSASSAFLFFNTNHQNVSGGTDQYTIQCGGANHTLMFKHGNSTGNVVFELDDTEHVRIPQDNKALKIGASQDLQIYHSGNWNYIQSHNSKNFVIQVNDNENAFVAIPDGQVQLYHNNNLKMWTDTTGITVQNRITAAGDSNTYMNIGPNDIIDLFTGGTNQIRMNANGDLLVHGTTLNNSSVAGQALQINGTTRPTLILRGNASGGNTCEIQFADNSGTDSDPGTRAGLIKYEHAGTYANHMHFHTNETERMVINHQGRVGISQSPAEIAGFAEQFQVGGIYGNNYAAAFKIKQSSGSLMRFATTSSGSYQLCGGITVNGTTTSFNTSSDYRLKENDVKISDGITRLKQLRPIRFNWKADPSTTEDGFFAHEVSPVVPESVNGEKDAPIDEIGEGYQKIDHSKLVPLLTAALQEAITEIETLKTKVAALEGS